MSEKEPVNKYLSEILNQRPPWLVRRGIPLVIIISCILISLIVILSGNLNRILNFF